MFIARESFNYLTKLGEVEGYTLTLVLFGMGVSIFVTLRGLINRWIENPNKASKKCI